MSRVGTKIFSLRTAKGMTQKQLAKLAGVSEKFIVEVESGKRVLGSDLLNRVSKILEQDLEEAGDYDTAETFSSVEKTKKEAPKPGLKETQKVWSDAFDAILKSVPVYDYSLDKLLETRQLPVVSNKVEGYPKEKVAFIEIQDQDMIGFRIAKGDRALVYLNHELENNSICLVEQNGKRMIRQIRKLDTDKLLLVNNDGRLMTETVSFKNIKILCKLIKLEIKL